MDSNFNFNHIISLVWPNECLKIQPWLENKNLVKSKLQKIKFSLLHYLTAVLIFQLVLGKKTSSCLFEKLREFHKGKRNIVLKKLYFYNLKSKIHAIHHNVFCLGNKVQTKKKSAKHRGENSSSLTHQQSSARPFGKCRVMSILDTPHDFYSLSREQKS